VPEMRYVYVTDICRWIGRIICDHRRVTAIAAVVYTIGALLTLRAIYDGNDTARQNYILTNRPNIIVGDIWTFPDPSGLSVVPRWENTGNVPVQVTAYVNWLFSHDPPPPNFFLVPTIKFTDAIGPKSGSTGIYNSISGPCIVNTAQQHSFRHIEVWGDAEYYDPLSAKKRETRFCWNILGIPTTGDARNPSRVAHTMCEKGNCADDDCKIYDNVAPPTLPQDTCVMTITPQTQPQQPAPTPAPSQNATPPQESPK